MNAEMLESTKDLSWRDWIVSCVYGSCMIIQMILTYFKYNCMGLNALAKSGWLVMAVSAVFGWMPIYTLKERGCVPEGKSYMKTTKLVDNGIYSVVRHPQYLAGVLISLSLVLVSQYWINVLLFLPLLAGTYIDSRRADMRLVEKFGEDYTRYMERVPALDPITGSLRHLRRRG
jgi:protein-S-isoprenylcysteine O-methyltransferase Ste14